MYKDAKYVKYQKNENLIEMFYNVLFTWRDYQIIDVLKGYCNLEGNAVREELICYFATEFQPDEEDYFGQEGVAFYFYSPAVAEDDECIVILTPEEFFNVVRKYYEKYILDNPDKKDEIDNLLKKLSVKLNVE